MALLDVLQSSTLVFLYTFFPFFLSARPTVTAYPSLAETKTLVQLRDTWKPELRSALSAYHLRPASSRETAESLAETKTLVQLRDTWKPELRSALSAYHLRPASSRETAGLGMYQSYNHLAVQPQHFTYQNHDHLAAHPQHFTSPPIDSLPVSHELSTASNLRDAFHGWPQSSTYHLKPSDLSRQLARGGGGHPSGYSEGTGVFLPKSVPPSKVAKPLGSRKTYQPTSKIPQQSSLPLPKSTVSTKSNPAPLEPLPANPPENLLPASVLEEIGPQHSIKRLD